MRNAKLGRLAAIFAVVLGSAVAISTQALGETSAPTTTPDVVPTVVAPPKHITIHRHFNPDDSASGSRLVWIARQEQRRIGGPSIVGRLWCESKYGTDMVGTGHAGPLQWDSTFYGMYAAALASIGRDVGVVQKKIVKKPVITHYSDGTERRSGTVRQHQTIRLHGRLPRRATPWHTWAAIRTGQAAAAGKISSTYWACTASNGSHY